MHCKNGDIFWGHKNYLTSDCKATYSSIEEIEAARVKEEAKIKAKEAEEKAIKSIGIIRFKIQKNVKNLKKK